MGAQWYQSLLLKLPYAKMNLKSLFLKKKIHNLKKSRDIFSLKKFNNYSGIIIWCFNIFVFILINADITQQKNELEH